MIEAWFSSSLMTASSSPSSVSKKPPLASKQDEYRIVSSVPRKAERRSSSCLWTLLRAADEPDAGHAVAPAVEGLLGRRDDARVVGQAEVVVGAEVEHLGAVRDAVTRPLRRDDHPLGLEEASRPDLVELAAELLPDAGEHLPTPPISASGAR